MYGGQRDCDSMESWGARALQLDMGGYDRAFEITYIGSESPGVGFFVMNRPV